MIFTRDLKPYTHESQRLLGNVFDQSKQQTRKEELVLSQTLGPVESDIKQTSVLQREEEIETSITEREDPESQTEKMKQTGS